MLKKVLVVSLFFSLLTNKTFCNSMDGKILFKKFFIDYLRYTLIPREKKLKERMISAEWQESAWAAQFLKDAYDSNIRQQNNGTNLLNTLTHNQTLTPAQQYVIEWIEATLKAEELKALFDHGQTVSMIIERRRTEYLQERFEKCAAYGNPQDCEYAKGLAEGFGRYASKK